jgi:fibronectin type 3 domain-containing protein
MSTRARLGVTRAVLAILLLFSTAYTQVQTNGSVALTGSVQLMAGGKHCVALAWSATQGQDISFRVYRSTTSGSHYQMVQSLIPCLHYMDLNVSNSTTYYYVVTTYDSSTNAESAYSNQVTVTTAN